VPVLQVPVLQVPVLQVPVLQDSHTLRKNLTTNSREGTPDFDLDFTFVVVGRDIVHP
jgi:hypothetical protein